MKHFVESDSRSSGVSDETIQTPEVMVRDNSRSFSNF